jgi:hypothetical protein
MSAFFLALLAAALATLAGRESVRVSRLAAALGSGAGLLVACWMASALGMALAAWLGVGIAALLHPDAKALLVAMTLLVGAVELLVLRAPPIPAEPTRSFGAIALVLAAGQLTGSAGFIVFALAGQAGLPFLTAAGGVFGTGCVLTAAWVVGSEWERALPIGAMRLAGAGLLLLAACAVAISALGLVG